ncbi:hypothetical protein FTUN_0701 [Frigoriglobus tundricola]|uniref:Uncharacterized protein n=1 Tax=Frigoriglobus tundricola TaxID=2774151 RepID=A0A6M5YIU3_9BACT|nr:hypothetical protein FTUN_0701 [Frigoriglobus tundricola]
MQTTGGKKYKNGRLHGGPEKHNRYGTNAARLGPDILVTTKRAATDEVAAR